MIKINTVGHIIEGEYRGWYLLVEPFDGGRGNGFLVLVSKDNCWTNKNGHYPNGSDGHDYCIHDMPNLVHFFRRRGWKVNWV